MELIKELQDHVKTITAPYKYPREIEFIDELPKTASGKIRRLELRQLEQLKKIDNMNKHEGMCFVSSCLLYVKAI